MEEDSVRELTLKDFEDIEVDPNWFQIDFLAAIATRALAILEHEEHRKKMKDKGKQKLSDSDHLEEHHTEKKKEKEKRKLSDSDHVDEQPRKKIKVEEERKREILQPRLSKGVRIKEFSKRVSRRCRETEQPRLSKGVCIRECSERGIRRDQQRKKIEDSLPHEEIVRKERVLKKPMVETESDQEYKKIKKSKKIIKKSPINHGPNPPPALPMEFREALQQLAQGKSIKDLNLVIQKGLFETDISICHNRLSMPSRHLLYSFLSEDEIKDLESYNGKNVKSIEADIIEPSLKQGKVDLRRWAMRKNSGNESISYVLTKTWNDIVYRNSLGIGDIVQVWSVRVDEQLCFLLARVPITGGDKVPSSDTEREAGPSASPSDPSEPGPSALSSDPDQDQNQDRGHDQ